MQGSRESGLPSCFSKVNCRLLAIMGQTLSEPVVDKVGELQPNRFCCLGTPLPSFSPHYVRLRFYTLSCVARPLAGRLLWSRCPAAVWHFALLTSGSHGPTSMIVILPVLFFSRGVPDSWLSAETLSPQDNTHSSSRSRIVFFFGTHGTIFDYR